MVRNDAPILFRWTTLAKDTEAIKFFVKPLPLRSRHRLPRRNDLPQTARNVVLHPTEVFCSGHKRSTAQSLQLNLFSYLCPTTA